MPGCSSMSLSRISCSWSPSKRVGPCQCALGFTSPVCWNRSTYLKTVWQETLSFLATSAGEVRKMRVSHIILQRKSMEYESGMALSNSRLDCNLNAAWSCARRSKSIICACATQFVTRNRKSTVLEWPLTYFECAQSVVHNYWELPLYTVDSSILNRASD